MPPPGSFRVLLIKKKERLGLLPQPLLLSPLLTRCFHEPMLTIIILEGACARFQGKSEDRMSVPFPLEPPFSRLFYLGVGLRSRTEHRLHPVSRFPLCVALLSLLLSGLSAVLSVSAPSRAQSRTGQCVSALAYSRPQGAPLRPPCSELWG